jgi:hypothetical protein
MPPGKAQMAQQGTGRRTELLLSTLRENARQAAAVADGWLGGPVAAWNRLARWRWRRLISPPTGPSVVIGRDNRLGGGRWCRRAI